VLRSPHSEPPHRPPCPRADRARRARHGHRDLR